MAWQGAQHLHSRSFVCGFCGFNIASSSGYSSSTLIEGNQGRIYVCTHCNKPTFFLAESQIPGIAPGDDVAHLPSEIAALYREARNAVAVGACTASVLACRKLLMNVAVSQGAKEGDSFVSYVNHLATAGFVPPNGRGWVDHIRSKGNEATHEIALMSQSDAQELIVFAEMLLKFVYEFPNRVPKK